MNKELERMNRLLQDNLVRLNMSQKMYRKEPLNYISEYEGLMYKLNIWGNLLRIDNPLFDNEITVIAIAKDQLNVFCDYFPLPFCRVFYSVVAGEASNDFDENNLSTAALRAISASKLQWLKMVNYHEARAIANVMLNRYKARHFRFDNDFYTADFLDLIGGTDDYDVYQSETYKSVYNRNFADIVHSPTYGRRVRGALSALSKANSDNGNGCVFWGGIERDELYNVLYNPQGNLFFILNWYQDKVDGGVFKVVKIIGGTAFMRYTDKNKRWL